MRRSFFERVSAELDGSREEYEAMVGMALVSLRNSGRSMSESESEEERYAVPVSGWRRTSRLSSSVPSDEVEIRLGIVMSEYVRQKALGHEEGELRWSS